MTLSANYYKSTSNYLIKKSIKREGHQTVVTSMFTVELPCEGDVT